ncbi:Phosphoribosylanthranilate isomerase [Indibacter alkaliphilus LW1]|uniref:phosphoribosylanthranilate isomerase n=1 Tax=Indibacter alkaliphilus (strain CCUG 57479 / KCTC 22604 / LW1) TaxID=1189612 RepID=S2DV19_INDAL|nr:phosphoribosylanthranilate isomerase [Indibacter alkaliphilus]EOZ93688.1 Phosphoribosylanthranilate isomerase [Indibacter alkaliphilus LW1]
MALKTFVKISSVNNLSDARYCAGMQVNLMGFNLEENSKNFISPEKFKEITDWLSGLEYVAEFEHTHPERILTHLKEYQGIHHIQIQEEIHLKMLVNTGFGIILHQKLEDITDLDELIKKSRSYDEHHVTLLLTSEQLALNASVIEKIRILAEGCQVLLGFGLEASNIEKTVDQTNIKGISLEGGDEIKPGLKDFDELAEILETLEIED